MFGIFAMIVGLIVLDQWIKVWAVHSLQTIGTIPLFEGVFHLTYVENRGAVAGIFQGKQLFLIIVTAIIIIALSAALLMKKVPGKMLPWCFGLIVGGGIGNLIDRIFRGFVVDYLDFRLINYPVFNFADCCVVVGVFAFAFYVLFIEGKEPKAATFCAEQDETTEMTEEEQPNEQ